MSGRLLFSLLWGAMMAASAEAGPFSLRYDADKAYPEDTGWDRQLYDPDGMLQRTIGNGLLTLDTTGSMLTMDAYQVATPRLVPAAGETLTATWRVMVPFTGGFPGASEVSVILVNPALEYVEIHIGQDHVEEDRYRLGWTEGFALISPALFHTYALKTVDFQNYDFFVDGTLAFSSDFHWQALGKGPKAAFGDFFIGGTTSIASWDYVEVAVTPEAHSMWIMTVLVGLVQLRK